MKNIFFFSILLFSLASTASTRFQFVPGGLNGMVIVKSGGLDGNTDSDFVNLFAFMNVPPEDSMLGKGKTVKTSTQDFALICGEYQTQCQVFLKKSSRVQMSPSQQTMRFEVQGAEADELILQFQMTGDRQMEFFTEDRKFHLWGEPEHFLMEASVAGF